MKYPTIGKRVRFFSTSLEVLIVKYSLSNDQNMSCYMKIESCVTKIWLVSSPICLTFSHWCFHHLLKNIFKQFICQRDKRSFFSLTTYYCLYVNFDAGNLVKPFYIHGFLIKVLKHAVGCQVKLALTLSTDINLLGLMLCLFFYVLVKCINLSDL